MNTDGNQRKENDSLISEMCNTASTCPICNKCYSFNEYDKKCISCFHMQGKNKCKHTDRERSFAIRRENFKVNLNGEIGEEFKDWIKQSFLNK